MTIDTTLLQNLSGIQVIAHRLVTAEAPVRRHKKRRNQSENYPARVQKKWTKRFGKKRVPGAVLFNERVIGGTQPVLYVHPDILEKLKEVSKC